MIVSMTAFGRQEDTGDWGNAIWEIKSVNHRYLDISIRMPEELRQMENKVREAIAAKVKRGKIDCILRYTNETGQESELQVDEAYAARVIRAAENLAITAPAALNPLDILRWPGVLNKTGLDPAQIETPLLALLDETLDLLLATRRREGEKINTMLSERCDACAEQITALRPRLPEIVSAIRERYLGRAQELSAELDRDRLEQEMLILSQKMDVAEELDRLEAHLGEVRRVLKERQPVGRRLDFLMQEMNREANTLGSKSAGIAMSNTSVELKVIIEQMREQIQNVE